MTTLNEKQLRPGVVCDLVDPIVNIDTYTPKIQEDSIVVVFKVKQNYDAAYDLSSFIEKLGDGILDTEAQEIPNSDGDYEVFCEFEREESFPKNFMDVLASIEKLGNKQHWKAEYYSVDELQPLTEETIVQHVRLIPGKTIREFLEYSHSTLLVERDLKLTSNTHNYSMTFTNAVEITDSQACIFMREGWEHMADMNVIFGPLYNTVRTKYGIIADRDGKHILFI